MRTLTDSMSRSLSRYLWPNVLRHWRKSNLMPRSSSTTCLIALRIISYRNPSSGSSREGRW